MLSPGSRFLLLNLPALLSPGFVVYLLCSFLRNRYFIDFSNVLCVLACLISVPAWISLQIMLKKRREREEAETLGARLPPCIPRKYPAGLDTLARLERESRYGYIGGFFDELAGRMGEVLNVDVLYNTAILTAEPEHVKMILATNFDGFHKGPLFLSQMNSVLGSGVFNADGDMWKFHRSMTRPFFSRERISDFEIFDRHAADAIRLLKERLGEGHAVNFQDLLSRFTLDSATEFLFGVDVKSMSAGLPYSPNSKPAKSGALVHPADAFAEAFSSAQDLLAGRNRKKSIWPLFELFGDKSQKHMKVISAFIDPILERCLRKGQEAELADKNDPSEVAAGLEDDATLLDHLVKQTKDLNILKDEILNIMIAGRDTTASLLTSLFYIFAMQPEIMTRVREEILTKIGPSRQPDYDDFRDMKYLRACLNETLRLFPAVPFDTRASIRGTTLPASDGGKPWYIPANTDIVYSIIRIHRRTDLWGPDALVFDPDRFLDERVGKYITPNPFIFIPFNAGPRICLGQQFAYNEASFMLVRMLQNFDKVELAPEAQPTGSRPPDAWKQLQGRGPIEQAWFQSHLTLHVKGGLWVKMSEAPAVADV